MTLLQPKMVVSVKIKMGMTVIFGKWIGILCRWVNISELLTIEEIDLPRCCYHQAPSPRTFNGLCAIVCQTV